jgi:hypothetical protein
MRRLGGAFLLALLAVDDGATATCCGVELKSRVLRGLEVLEVRRLAVVGDRGPRSVRSARALYVALDVLVVLDGVELLVG